MLTSDPGSRTAADMCVCLCLHCLFDHIAQLGMRNTDKLAAGACVLFVHHVIPSLGTPAELCEKQSSSALANNAVRLTQKWLSWNC